MANLTTRTLHPLPFEHLEPHRFEDLVRQLAYGFTTWQVLEPTGRLGNDQGIDIRGVELVVGGRHSEHEQSEDEDGDEPDGRAAGEERVWRIQCKREKRIGPAAMRTIVADLVPDPALAPYGVIVAAACDVSADTIAAFRAEYLARGVRAGRLWTRATLEDLLFRPEHDGLLFAYFGISLGARRRSRLQALRHAIATKRTLLRTLGADSAWSRPNGHVLVRDVDGEGYPYEDDVPGFAARSCPPWHPVLVEQLAVGGIVVRSRDYQGWVRPDGTWDLLEETAEAHIGWSGWAAERRRKATDRDARHRARRRAEQVPQPERVTVEEAWALPFGNIVQIDPIGDPFHPVPHLFCLYQGDRGPYKTGPVLGYRDGPRIITLLPENRRPLFASLPPLGPEPEPPPDSVKEELGPSD